MTGLAATTIVALAVFGLAGGVGITAVGPGGVLPTIGLFALTTLPPATIAGTAIVTHVATGVVGTAAYYRSGQLRDPATKKTATTLAVAALIGTPIGVLANSTVSKRAFGLVLATFAVTAAVALWRRQSSSQDAISRRTRTGHPSSVAVATVGLAVAAAAGIAGLGGPMLSVPLLAMLGVPMLEALAAAQAQSIVVAAVGAVGYTAAGAVDWELAALVGIPELVGVLIGWRIARSVPNRALKNTLIVALLALAPFLILKA